MIIDGYKYEFDPYPYKLGDSILWEKLIYKALEIDSYMAEILYWYRAVGALLVTSQKFGFCIKPIILGENNSQWGWESKEEWLKEKQYLVPYAEKVAKILMEIRKEM